MAVPVFGVEGDLGGVTVTKTRARRPRSHTNGHGRVHDVTVLVEEELVDEVRGGVEHGVSMVGLVAGKLVEVT